MHGERSRVAGAMSVRRLVMLAAVVCGALVSAACWDVARWVQS